MIKRLKQKLHRKQVSHYAPVIKGILSQNLSFDLIQQELNLNFNSLYDYMTFISPIYFPDLSDFDNLCFYLRYHEAKKEITQRLFKEIVYPFFLFLLCFLMTLYFQDIFAPHIIRILDDFNVSSSKLSLILFFTLCLKNLWFLFFLLLFFMCFVLMLKDMPFVVYIRFHHLKCFGLVKNVLTYRFCLVYHFLLEHQQNIQLFFEVIQNVKGMDDVKWLSFHIKDALEKGNPYLDAINLKYFNALFKIYLDKGFYTKNLPQVLNEYLIFLQGRIEVQITMSLRWFKIFVYSYVVVFVLIYYFFLFQPLSILEGLV